MSLECGSKLTLCLVGDSESVSQAGHGRKPGKIPLETSGLLITRKLCLEKSEKKRINHSTMKRVDTSGLRS